MRAGILLSLVLTIACQTALRKPGAGAGAKPPQPPPDPPAAKPTSFEGLGAQTKEAFQSYLKERALTPAAAADAKPAAAIMAAAEKGAKMPAEDIAAVYQDPAWPAFVEAQEAEAKSAAVPAVAKPTPVTPSAAAGRIDLHNKPEFIAGMTLLSVGVLGTLPAYRNWHVQQKSITKNSLDIDSARQTLAVRNADWQTLHEPGRIFYQGRGEAHQPGRSLVHVASDGRVTMVADSSSAGADGLNFSRRTGLKGYLARNADGSPSNAPTFDHFLRKYDADSKAIAQSIDVKTQENVSFRRQQFAGYVVAGLAAAIGITLVAQAALGLSAPPQSPEQKLLHKLAQIHKQVMVVRGRMRAPAH